MDTVKILILIALCVVLASSLWVLATPAGTGSQPTVTPTRPTPAQGPGSWAACSSGSWSFRPTWFGDWNVLALRRLRGQALAEIHAVEGQPATIDTDSLALDGTDPWDLVAIGQSQRLHGLQPVHLRLA